jgi:nicotinamide mononucleotide transporter
MPPLEIAANALTALSILLAARNSVHTWWLGIAGCAAFTAVFGQARLYADATLQVFFVVTSVVGWLQWLHGGCDAEPRPVTRASAMTLALMAAGAAAVTVGYGALLHRFTNAFAPFVDSAVLALSVVAQCLLMQRRLDTWPAWLAVNSISVPLYLVRGLHLTAALYVLYWFNAWYGWWHWRREWRAAGGAAGAEA